MPDFRRMQAEAEIATVNEALKAGYPPHVASGSHTKSAVRWATEKTGANRCTMRDNIGIPGKPGRYQFLYGLSPDWSLYHPEQTQAEDEPPSPFAIDRPPEPAYAAGYAIDLMSYPDNTFIFGAAGDLHAGSKYCRWDVRQSLYDWFIEEGAQCNFDTGNWIEGAAKFNKGDVDAHGLDEQVKLLAERHPRGLPTCAVWGDDHEGWLAQREQVDVGRYCESVMREAGHEWTNMGYLEARVRLINANTGVVSSMAVCHPGGGSAYAVSYKFQKIIESMEGGEKPAIGLYGHYHKLIAFNVRNVWVIGTGCQQDQTPFLRKQSIEAHVGGVLVKLWQDPETGAIMRCRPEMNRFFNRDWGDGPRWSKHGTISQPIKSK